jgi:hypothetical protein
MPRKQCFKQSDIIGYCKNNTSKYSNYNEKIEKGFCYMLALYWVVDPKKMIKIIDDLYEKEDFQVHKMEEDEKKIKIFYPLIPLQIKSEDNYNETFQVYKMEEDEMIKFFNLLMLLQIKSEDNYNEMFKKNKNTYTHNWIDVKDRMKFDQYFINNFYNGLHNNQSDETKKIIISGKEYRRDEIKTPNFFHSLLNGKKSLLIHVYYTQAGENNQNIAGAHSVVVMNANNGQCVIFFDPNFGNYVFCSKEFEKLDEFIMKHFKEACKFIDYTLQIMVVDLAKNCVSLNPDPICCYI